MNFTSKSIVATALITTSILPSSSFLVNDISYANSIEYRVVNGYSVNFRKGPNTSYSSLGKLNTGDKVEYIGISGSWTKVKYNNQIGYIYSKYVSTIENKVEIKYVNCSNLNVRTGASTNYSIITTIPRDTQVEVISTSNGWAKVKIGSTMGYVSSQYLSSEKSSNSTNSTDSSTSQSSRVDKVISLAKSLLGKPYVWGAQGPSSFDCSGYTYYVYKSATGITLPRVSKDQANYGTTISKSNLKIGDLVFFDTTGINDKNVSHTGIYIGSGQFIHASSSKGKVVISDLSSGYYSNAFVRGKRVL